MSELKYSGRFLIKGFDWKPSKLDSTGEVKDQSVLKASVDVIGDPISEFVEFATATNGERMRVTIDPGPEGGGEAFEADCFLKGAKWAQGSGSSIACSIEFAFEDREKTIAFVGMRLAMDAGQVFEADVVLVCKTAATLPFEGDADEG